MSFLMCPFCAGFTYGGIGVLKNHVIEIHMSKDGNLYGTWTADQSRKLALLECFIIRVYFPEDKFVNVRLSEFFTERSHLQIIAHRKTRKYTRILNELNGASSESNNVYNDCTVSPGRNSHNVSYPSLSSSSPIQSVTERNDNLFQEFDEVTEWSKDLRQNIDLITEDMACVDCAAENSYGLTLCDLMFSRKRGLAPQKHERHKQEYSSGASLQSFFNSKYVHWSEEEMKSLASQEVQLCAYVPPKYINQELQKYFDYRTKNQITYIRKTDRYIKTRNMVQENMDIPPNYMHKTSYDENESFTFWLLEHCEIELKIGDKYLVLNDNFDDNEFVEDNLVIKEITSNDVVPN